MSDLLDSVQLTRECFEDFHVLNRSFLEMADQTTPSANLDAALEGERDPTALAENCKKLMNRVVAAMNRMERQGHTLSKQEPRPRPVMTHTRTFVIMEVEAATYNEIKDKLLEADYDHAIHDQGEHGTVLDMHGIALGTK